MLGAAFAVLSVSFQYGTHIGEYAVERATHTLHLELTGRIVHPGTRPEAGGCRAPW